MSSTTTRRQDPHRGAGVRHHQQRRHPQGPLHAGRGPRGHREDHPRACRSRPTWPRQGIKTVLVAVEESPEDLVTTGDTLGLDLSEAVKDGRLRVTDASRPDGRPDGGDRRLRHLGPHAPHRGHRQADRRQGHRGGLRHRAVQPPPAPGAAAQPVLPAHPLLQADGPHLDRARGGGGGLRPAHHPRASRTTSATW